MFINEFITTELDCHYVGTKIPGVAPYGGLSLDERADVTVLMQRGVSDTLQQQYRDL